MRCLLAVAAGLCLSLCSGQRRRRGEFGSGASPLGDGARREAMAFRRGTGVLRAREQSVLVEGDDGRLRCSLELKVRTRTVPHNPVLRPVVEGLDCVTGRGGAGLPAQTCCRPTPSTLENFLGPAAVTADVVYWRGQLGKALGAAGDWRCFPSVLVIGAQKSGSTALTGMLLHHPLVRFAKTKELHYFDKNETQCTGALPYLLKFASAVSAAMPPALVRPRFVTAEATPFYLADPHACGRIATQLPFGRLVVLVREPVARAFSEYEMKARRVEEQDLFVNALENAHAARLFGCVARVGLANISRGLRECMPAELVQSKKFDLLLASIKVQARHRGAVLSRTASAVSELTLGWMRDCFTIDRAGGDFVSKTTAKLEADLAKRVFGSFSGVSSRSRVHFDTATCFKKGTRERLEDLEGVMGDEMRLLRACARAAFPRWDSTAAPPDARQAAVMIERCVVVKTGISIQYLYRGLYAAQLKRCANSGVPSEAILVLDSQELRARPQKTLDALAAHAGIERFTYDPSLFEPDALQESIRAKFPTFENTGWRLDSQYTHHLPERLRSEMARFFAPHNRLLYDLIGRNLGWPEH